MAPILAEFILEDEKLVTDGIPSDRIPSKARVALASEFCLFKHLICQHMTKNKCEPTLKILSNFLPIVKIPPMFNEAEVLPWRLPNFGKVDALGPTNFASYPEIDSNRLY